MVISILYKGKGPSDLCKSHRPVSLTDATCRVIDKALQLALNKVVPTVLCGVNRAFLPGERMENDTLSMVEVARYCHAHRGGAIACLDADKAYDRVEVDFLSKFCMQIAMGFPESFLDVIRDTSYV